MTALLLPGVDPAPADEALRRAALSQWYTPPDLAARFVRWALDGLPVVRGRQQLTVLDPSCGRGALIDPLLADPRVVRVVGVDIDADNVAHCAARFARYGDRVQVAVRGFLGMGPSCYDVGAQQHLKHDLAVMNPPYEDEADADHVAHASLFGERVCALVRLAFLSGEGRYRVVWRHHQLHRLAILRTRPDFGGDYTPRYDYCCVDVSRAGHRFDSAPDRVEVQWWP